jgi:hypothetical protein
MAGQGGARAGAGKKRMPDHLKVVKGTFRKDRAKDPPKESGKPAKPPSYLSDRATYYFGYYVKLMEGRASETFTEILALLSIRSEEVEAFHTGVKSTEGRSENAAYKEAMRHKHTLLIECGLTPASIGRMGGGKKKPEADPWDDL